jgi:single-stranded DNA-specific DHH superfamily exonuclease
MLTNKEVKEIREHLEKAQNPLFFFDNDPDGLCSFLLLQRYAGKGKGVPIKSFPGMVEGYFRKVIELNPDYIFILDKPIVSEGFFSEARKRNIPIVWIDHHFIDRNNVPEFVHYYNPLFSENIKEIEKNDEIPIGEPVTYLCYHIANKKEDLWIAVVGCASDSYFPDLYDEFKKMYPDLALDKDFSGKQTNAQKAFEIVYGSPFGKIVKLFSFGLKDSVTNVIFLLKYLMKIKNPYEILEENEQNYLLHKRFREINRRYEKLIEKAGKNFMEERKVLFFSYGGELSISSDLANELSYMFKDKVIVVAYLTGVKANVSVRGKNIRESVLKVVSELEDATGGGHKDAVGCKVRVEDLDFFKERLISILD